MKMYLRERLGENWAPLIRRRDAINFREEQIDNDDTVGKRLNEAWKQREGYVNNQETKALHHLRTPIMGENIENMIVSEQEEENEGEEDEEVEEEEMFEF